jgi:hypothetical protein
MFELFANLFKRCTFQGKSDYDAIEKFNDILDMGYRFCSKEEQLINMFYLFHIVAARNEKLTEH